MVLFLLVLHLLYHIVYTNSVRFWCHVVDVACGWCACFSM